MEVVLLATVAAAVARVDTGSFLTNFLVQGHRIRSLLVRAARIRVSMYKAITETTPCLTPILLRVVAVAQQMLRMLHQTATVAVPAVVVKVALLEGSALEVRVTLQTLLRPKVTTVVTQERVLAVVLAAVVAVVLVVLVVLARVQEAVL